MGLARIGLLLTFLLVSCAFTSIYQRNRALLIENGLRNSVARAARQQREGDIAVSIQLHRKLTQLQNDAKLELNAQRQSQLRADRASLRLKVASMQRHNAKLAQHKSKSAMAQLQRALSNTKYAAQLKSDMMQLRKVTGAASNDMRHPIYATSAASAATVLTAWRVEPWFVDKTFCDGYISKGFKAAAMAVKDGDKSQEALARFLYPMFAEHSAGVERISQLIKKTDAFFAKHGLHYVLYAGSLIGAMRHGDVIPFDTDADIQVPAHEFDKIWDLRDEVKRDLHCTVSRSSMSFLFMGNGVKIDVWPVYDSWDEGKPPPAEAPPRNPNRPWVSVKYWRDDNIPPAEIVAAVRHKFGGTAANVPAKATFYLKRLYGKNVLDTVKVWNDDFNHQHCNDCKWSPNTYVVPIADFNAVHKQFVADMQTQYGC